MIGEGRGGVMRWMEGQVLKIDGSTSYFFIRVCCMCIALLIGTFDELIRNFFIPPACKREGTL